MNPLFGWGPDCRYSWGTAKRMLEDQGPSPKIDWPTEDDDESMKVTNYFAVANQGGDDGSAGQSSDELYGWYGRPLTESVF
jgi:ribonuclease H2 subunit A